MKFVSWNVNGIRACLQKGFEDVFHAINADIFCLQETKAQPHQVELDLPGYEQFWYSAEKKGYSGTAIFAKRTPLNVTYGVGVEELDHEGRVIALEYPEFYFLTCYTPNAQDGLKRIDHRMAWEDAFREHLCTLDAIKPVVVCGDLNVAHNEIDLKNPGPNRGNAGFSDEERESATPTLRGHIPGGATAITRGRTTQAGALTIFWSPTVCATASSPRPSIPKFSDPITARWGWN